MSDEQSDFSLDKVQSLFDSWADGDRSERMATGHEHAARAALGELQVLPGQQGRLRSSG